MQQYWSRWSDGTYFTGDGARLDEDGFYWLLGRVDDVLNVAGHRLGTMEVESALVDHPKVAEAAVVGKPHEIKGQAVAAFVTLKEGAESDATNLPRVKGACGSQDRRDRSSRSDFVRRGSAEDTIGKNHAAPASRYRRGQGVGRYDDARRSRRRRTTEVGYRKRNEGPELSRIVPVSHSLLKCPHRRCNGRLGLRGDGGPNGQEWAGKHGQRNGHRDRSQRTSLGGGPFARSSGPGGLRARRVRRCGVA